jgi:electron transport complex protein RnfD
MNSVESAERFIVSVSPHIRDDITIARIMWTVSLSLIPAFLAGVYYFGPRALLVTLLCIVSAVVSEYAMQKILHREITISDGSAVLTGLLLGMNLPASLWSVSPFTLHIPVIGSVVAVAITKQLFGGLGYNIFNPALIGRAFLLICWPRNMTIWYKPEANFLSMDAVSTATPLGILKEAGIDKLVEVFNGDKMDLYSSLFFGARSGSIGETSVLLLLVGAAYLVYKRYITLHIPLSFLATVAVLAWIFGGGSDPETEKMLFFAGDPLIHLLSGGLILGAFFMATDYVTCPSILKGQIIFGVGCGVLTIVIRLWAGYPEGVMFAILLMNCFAPLIDRTFKATPFGYRPGIET